MAARMRYVCPTCDRIFADETGTCPDDGTKTLPVANSQAGALVGTVLDNRFRIDKLIGEGGMGAVYVGTQTSIDRQVAIKVIRAEIGHDAEAVKRFHREAQVISRLQHSNIVHLVDFGQTKEGLLYLVMEYVKGRPLTAEIAKGPMAVGRVQAIIGQVCDALSQAHQGGVVHRDLKPDNILLTSQAGTVDVVKILDFGIAKVASDGPGQASALTQAGAIMGTPQYMSPEQIDGKGEVTASADLYALAVIAFEMLAGVPPFYDSTAITLLIKHLKDVPPRVREVAPKVNVSAAMEEFLRSGLAKDPASRSRDAMAFKGEFAAVAADVPASLQAASDVEYAPTIEGGTVPHGAEPMSTLAGSLPVASPQATMMPAKPAAQLVDAPVAAPRPGRAPAEPQPTVSFDGATADVDLDAPARALAPASLPSRPVPAAVVPPRGQLRPAPRPHMATAPVPAALEPAPALSKSEQMTVVAAVVPQGQRAPAGVPAKRLPVGLIAAGLGFVVLAAVAAVVATGAMQSKPAPAVPQVAAQAPVAAPEPVVAAAKAPEPAVPAPAPAPATAVVAPVVVPAAAPAVVPEAAAPAVKKPGRPAGDKGKKAFNRDELRLE